MSNKPIWARQGALVVFVCALVVGCEESVPDPGEECEHDCAIECAGSVVPDCVADCMKGCPGATSEAQSALVAASYVYSITDDNAPATATNCNNPNSSAWCKCGSDYSDAPSTGRCNEIGSTVIMRFPPMGCTVSSAALSYTSYVSTYANSGGVDVEVHRVLRPLSDPPSGQSGYCAPTDKASWFRSGPEAWTAAGAKGNGTDRSSAMAQRIDANGGALGTFIAEHDSTATERFDVTALLNECDPAASCAFAQYVASGVHLGMYLDNVAIDRTCGASEVCGNGTVAGSETCDDSNTTAGDGCSATCQIETGYACSGAPSTCSTVCGDGLTKGVEECDDGNLVSHDGCSATCTAEVCTCE